MIRLRFKSIKTDVVLYIGPSAIPDRFSHVSKRFAFKFKDLTEAEFAVGDWARKTWPQLGMNAYTVEEVDL